MQGLENNNIDLKNLPSTPLYPLKNPILTPEQLEQKKKDLIVDLNQKSKELTELGLLDKLGGFVGYQTENAKEREKQLTDLKTQALDNKLEFKDLPTALKDECLKNSLILLKVFKKLFFVNFPIVFKTPTRFLLE